MTKLLDDETLERSSVVANCAMNRERGLAGYTRELGFDVLAEIHARLERVERVRWIDLCCGEGRALIEAAHRLESAGLAERVEIVGVDLTDHFAAPAPPAVRLVTASVTSWEPGGGADLVTCVHGLHYVGDNLAVLARAASWLTGDGLLGASFDTRTIQFDGKPGGRRLTTALRAAGLEYDSRRHHILSHGPRMFEPPLRYVGADDTAGPNYTGQPAVDSHYSSVP